MSVRIQPRAQLDILELADELGAVYPNVGRAFLARVDVDETIRFLERFPRVGAESPVPLPVVPTIRFFSVRRFRNYLIAFRPFSDGTGVEVVRVLDGRRDVRDIFDES
jgi:plasmid stabilization system protein ParE